MSTRRLEVVITGDADSLSRSFRKVNGELDHSEKKTSKFGTALSGLGRSLATGGAVAGFTALTATLANGVQQMREQQEASAQTARVIANTGMAAGVTQKHVEDLSKSLQDLTGSQDDAIQSAANVILTFTRIGAADGVFDRTVKIANDMSVALGKDLPAAARIVGRALDDPIKGLGALSRIGVKFNDDQKAAFVTWVKQGDIARAQGVILTALERRYKNAAQSQGELTETTQRLQRKWDDLSQALVSNGIVYANRALKSLNEYIDTNVIPTIETLRRAWNSNFLGMAGTAKAVINTVVSNIRTQMRVMLGIVSAALAVLRGDWSAAWNSLKGIVSAVVANVKQLFGSLPSALASAGRAAGEAFVGGFLSALAGLASRARALIPFGGGGGPSGVVPKSLGGSGAAPSGGGGGGNFQNAFVSGGVFALRRVATGSETDLTRTAGAGDRSAQTARLSAEAAARTAGRTSQEISDAGDRAYATARLGTITTLRSSIETRRASLVKKLTKARRVRSQVKVPRTGPARQKALDKRARMTDAINEILDELETLAANDADLVSEAEDLGATVADIDRSAEAEQASEAAAAASAALDAAVALAALTPGTEDDLAAAKAVESAAQSGLAAAQASGDSAAIASAARALLSARQNREQIEATMKNTEAVNANTDALSQAFGGSTVFSYRGQDYSLRSLAPPSSDRLVGAEVGL